ncbi:unnamed protein product [Musa acuminata subsp. malaccensis]|uniref:(wild Malaysian banana) hypothetical protein n=1 Tax=Musa acuminata subsp. malaccensis TaxID=214687 RepID=A0A804L0J9_MUSAM|nr:unnamed protein product [Musa acuminata subsp. malaccensis]
MRTSFPFASFAVRNEIIGRANYPFPKGFTSLRRWKVVEIHLVLELAL